MLRIGAKISLIIRWVLLVDLSGDFVALQAATLNQRVQKIPHQRYERQREIEY